MNYHIFWDDYDNDASGHQPFTKQEEASNFIKELTDRGVLLENITVIYGVRCTIEPKEIVKTWSINKREQ